VIQPVAKFEKEEPEQAEKSAKAFFANIQELLGE